jgi:hypothetical protein
MLLTRTYRSPDGLIVARVSLEDTWAEYLVSVYQNGRSVSAHYYETEAQAIDAARGSVASGIAPRSQTVTKMGELSLVPML